MENAGAREESQVPNRRGNETPGTNNKQANKNRHPPSPRRLPARGALGVTIFEFSGLSEGAPAATWDRSGEKQKEYVDVNYTLRFLTTLSPPPSPLPLPEIGRSTSRGTRANIRTNVVDVKKKSV